MSLGSFRTKAAAERALLLAGADQQRGAWVDPRNGKITLEAYANRWLAHRHTLRIRTVELYRSQLDNHIVPALGRRELSKLSTAEVRVWFANLVQESGLAPTTAAKCYRLLRAILNTAVEDELIVKNPCVIKGAATERSPERPVATIAQVDALATAIDPRWRALVLLATYGSLRWGELTALTRQRIDLQAGTARRERRCTTSTPRGSETKRSPLPSMRRLDRRRRGRRRPVPPGRCPAFRTLGRCQSSTSSTSKGATTARRCRSCGRRWSTRSSAPSIRSR